MNYPQFIILFSGKRKTGKDFVSEKLLKRIGTDKCVLIRISEPIKSYYAKQKNLDLSELLSDNPYKEQYRLEMINWSDEIRKETPGYFCEAACAKAPLKPIWIVSDIRRKTDIKWFKDIYNCRIKTIRLIANFQIRQERGWKFTKGVDDVTSECDLDEYDQWDLCVKNESSSDSDVAVKEILDLIGF